MKYFSAQFTITNAGPPLKRAIITTLDNGTIVSIDDNGGDLAEKHSVEYYNGIIIPGFVNTHCHLELSHMKGKIQKGGGLGVFLSNVSKNRNEGADLITSSAGKADKDMFREGISLCADICNTPLSFSIKQRSSIKYLSLLEVFGIDRAKAEIRIAELDKLASQAVEAGIPFQMVPHAAYSMSLSLLRLLKTRTVENKVTSVHFMETEGEKVFLSSHSGPLLEIFSESGMLTSSLETPGSHARLALEEISPSGNLILVHNTFADRETINAVNERGKVFWCLCPNSNLYIENRIPPVGMMAAEGCEIVIGTDSLASNTRLSIIEELKTIQKNFPALSVEDLVKWSTFNGAKALGELERFGTIETGKNPGLLLLQNVDLVNMKLKEDTFVIRLI
jgi:cytosine/adenosine deaminase-related metal-dependent hydrolase